MPKNEVLVLELLENFWQKIVFKHQIFGDLVDTLLDLSEFDSLENQHQTKNVLKCIHKIFEKSFSHP